MIKAITFRIGGVAAIQRANNLNYVIIRIEDTRGCRLLPVGKLFGEFDTVGFQFFADSFGGVDGEGEVRETPVGLFVTVGDFVVGVGFSAPVVG